MYEDTEVEVIYELNDLIGAKRQGKFDGKKNVKIWKRQKGIHKGSQNTFAKEVNATKCEEYKVISLITHASKILLRVLNKRLEGKDRDYIRKTQFGFKRGCGTRDAIGVMRILCEKVLDNGKEFDVCFMD
ncbi:uncharacterized protein LOC119589602 [Penaeus monodon]|uniref:uncharacterized protein LOC119589602 n=1 Tax=Penaeus monodon TaxID=6687 RepID=UPI0018A7CE0A|nr:uncharacterized protein LOC119589602 [Penaeus monodon]